MRYLLISPFGVVVKDFKRYDELVRYAEQKEIDLLEYEMDKIIFCRICRKWYPSYHKSKKGAMCIHCQENLEEK